MQLQVQSSVLTGLRKFFRLRLLNLDADRVQELLKTMEKEVANIKSDLLKMTWYMRGGLSYEEAMNLSQSERSIVGDIIKENLETTKKSRLPFF